MLGQYLKHLLIHTPFEGVARGLRDVLSTPSRFSHRELEAIREEERYVAQACRMILTPQSNTIDVGAHLGSQLGVLVDLAPEGHHIAFEPVPHKARWLRRKFPRVDVREAALHNGSQRSEFFVNTSQPGYSGLRPHKAQDDVLERIVVQQCSLDEAIGPNRDIDFIKIDVEGGELCVLQGASELIERCRPTLLFESTRSGTSAWNVTPDELFEFLHVRGYSVFFPRAFVCNGAALTEAEFVEAHEYPFRALNFIAVAHERPLGRRLRRSDATPLQSERVRVSERSRVA
jgi:FkbM family methyltransferase